MCRFSAAFALSTVCRRLYQDGACADSHMQQERLVVAVECDGGRTGFGWHAGGHRSAHGG
jgi:hypothetical protein